MQTGSRAAPSPWAAETRSCSSLVLMQETAERVESAYVAWRALAHDRRTGRGSGGLSRSARCGGWVLSCWMYTFRTCSKCPRPTISSQSRHSARTVRTLRSADAFALGACTGVKSTSAPLSGTPHRSCGRTSHPDRAAGKRTCRPRSPQAPTTGYEPAGWPRRPPGGGTASAKCRSVWFTGL